METWQWRWYGRKSLVMQLDVQWKAVRPLMLLDQSVGES